MASAGTLDTSKCEYCYLSNHAIDHCWKLHGKPPRQANITQVDRSRIIQTKPSPQGLPASYEDFLKWCQNNPNSGSTASIAHTGNSSVCLSQSSLGPWVIDSGASDHVTGNKSLFSSLSTSGFLPSITSANGSQTQSQGIGTVQILPSLSVDSVLYVPGCPFNLLSVNRLTRSLDCIVTFTNSNVTLQDRSSGRTIGVGCESQGLYYLSLTSNTCSATDSSLTIHAQLGHPSLPKLQKLVPSLSKLSSLHCESCQLGKHTRNHFPDRVNKRASSPFALVHSDVWGPSRTMSTLESKYFVTFIDDFSRCTWIFLMKNRSELFPIFQKFYQEIKTQFGVSIRTLRSDNAREYLSHQFQNFMALNGILHQTSCPHTPQQNGVAERKNRHLIETTRTLLLHGNVPFRFWGDAVLTACYLINRMPSSVLDGNIPHSILFPHSPLHSVPPRVFGSTCFVHNLSPGLDKLSARSLKCVFLGYHRSQKGYRCYSPTLRRYLVSADVTFFESVPYFEPNNLTPEPLQDTTPEPIQEVTIVPLEPCQSVPPDTPPVDPPTSKPLQTYQRRPKPSAPTPVPEIIEDSPPTPSPSPDPVPQPEPNLPDVIRKGTRSTRNPSPHYIDFCYSRLSPLHYTCLSSLSSVSIPKSPGEALSHPEWRQAMIDEMCALQSSGTWELVPLPPGKSLVGCRWLYTVKVGPDGKIDRFKARLVAKGYTQIFGLDYSDTFSPVAKMASIRLLLSIAAIQHWPLHQLDIKNAFLHGDLDEEVYMEQPPGFVAQGESSNMVCRLHRSLYGLKQSPRAWFGRFSTAVQQFGLIRSEADHSVFYRHSVQGCIYLIVYVDDIVITGSDQQGILQLKQYLSNQFQTKDLGKLRYFLGIEVAQSKDGIVISQRKYAMDILEETGLLNAKPVDTPMDPNIKLLPNQGEPLSDSGRYRRLVGKLNYLTVTRPDISFAVSVVSQFLNSPCQEHMDAVIRILKYIKGAPGKGLIYKDRGHTQIVGYSDADWAGSPIDRRSTSGYCVLVGGNLISWKSKKQNVVARSSAEAEYRAMALVTCELIWLKQLLKELQFENAKPMTLICDNQAALHIASNPVFHERTKHIEIDCHFVREKIESGDIVTNFVNSNDQLADVFTKSLRGPRINYICGKLGAFDLYAPA
ncbi:putative mitochondrial protein [Trifolium repens]|nr:putative mitochondrial protein [Trifolium repens]